MKNRQLELLIFLLKYKKSTYHELATHFEVSRKTIERDIDRLSAIGIPVRCQQGSGGGVTLDESYKFSQSFFTPEDIGHMVTALHIARTFTANPQNKEIIHKLTLIDPNLTEFFQQNVSQHFFLDLYAPPVNFETDIFSQINRCLDLKVYATINDVVEVVPLSYVFKTDGIHLFCFKNDYKLIKISEITAFNLTDVEFSGDFLPYDTWKNNHQKLSET
ncbi:MAG: HTH domain-containing protein [Eubacteriales bacterium]